MESVHVLKSTIKLAPGVYKWWCSKEMLKQILKKLNCYSSVNIDRDIEHCIYNKQQLYCIYVGIAKNESLNSRIEWHISNHTASQLQSKNVSISTLRHSLAAIFFNDISTSINEALNKLMENLFVSIHYESQFDIGSVEASQEIHKIESDILKSDKFYALNIENNNHDLASTSTKVLKTLRKDAKDLAIKKIRGII
jgi:hypothetical protein